MFNIFGHLAGDRRGAQRHYLSVPLRRHIRNSSSEFSSQTEDVSDVGVFFETEHQIGTGAVLDLLLDIPSAVGGDCGSLWCTGRVVRVACRGKKQGVGVQFDCFEVVDGQQFDYGSALSVAT